MFIKTPPLTQNCASANVTDDGVAVQKAEENDAEMPVKHWYAACVKMNCERKVATQINAMGIETFVPTQTQVRQWSDRKKKVQVVVIPLIVFINATDEEARQAEQLSTVSRLMRAPGQKQPAAIPDKQIDTLKFLLHQQEVAVEFSNKSFRKGDKVKVMRGHLAGIEGTVVQAENGHLLAIEIDIIGNVLIKIDISDLAKA